MAQFLQTSETAGKMVKKDYELLEHTADIRIMVKGAELKDLFANAARAMFDIISDQRPKTTDQRLKNKKFTIKQKAESLDELFVNWLNDLLSLSSAKELIFSDFKIKKINEKEIEAQVSGRPAADYEINTEIKAATYHQLRIEKKKAGWEAEVVLDV